MWSTVQLLGSWSFDASSVISSVTEFRSDPMARSSLHETYKSHQTADMESVSGSCLSQESDYDLEDSLTRQLS
jgi:copper(I)-binding protein